MSGNRKNSGLPEFSQQELTGVQIGKIPACRDFLSRNLREYKSEKFRLAGIFSAGTYGNRTIGELAPLFGQVLIIDEWLLFPLKESEARDLLEIVEARNRKASTIFCSQFDVAGWYLKIGEPTVADAVCDRIVNDSYTIKIEGDSMRKRTGLCE